MLVKMYAEHGSASGFCDHWTSTEELHGNHVAKEMLMLCMILDKMLSSDTTFAMTEGCEIICARVYALRKAFQEVQTQSAVSKNEYPLRCVCEQL